MFSWLALFPSWLELILFTVICAAIVSAVHAAFRRIVPPESLIAHHDVAGFLIAVVGVVYAVVLGFVVVSVWLHFDTAQHTADVEAGDAAQLFTLARNLPEPVRSHLRTNVADYAFEVRDHEWPMLVDDEQSFRARQLLVDAEDTIGSAVASKTSSLSLALQEWSGREDAYAVLRDLQFQRRARLIDAGSGIPSTLYVALIMGAAIVIAFTFLFGISKALLQLTMTALVTASIAVLFGVIVALDRPYSGSVRVAPEAWTLVIDNHDLAHYRSISR